MSIVKSLGDSLNNNSYETPAGSNLSAWLDFIAVIESEMKKIIESPDIPINTDIMSSFFITPMPMIGRCTICMKEQVFEAEVTLLPMNVLQAPSLIEINLEDVIKQPAYLMSPFFKKYRCKCSGKSHLIR